MQAHGILLIHPRTPSAKHGYVGEAGASNPNLFFKRAKKTHRELHEEVFAPAKVSIEQASSKLPGEINTRRPIGSRTTNARPALPQAASAVPPVPPLPRSKRPSLPISSHNTEARHSSSSTPPGQPTDHLTSSHGIKNTYIRFSQVLTSR